MVGKRRVFGATFESKVAFAVAKGTGRQPNWRARSASTRAR